MFLSKLFGLRKAITAAVVGGFDDGIAILEQRFTVLAGTIANEEKAASDAAILDAEFSVLPLPQLPAPTKRRKSARG